MDKIRLTSLIKDPNQLTAEDAKALRDLKKEYPYFQALTPLIVLADKEFDPYAEKSDLQTAAIYSLDRKHLKQLLSSHNGQSTEIIKHPVVEQKDHQALEKVQDTETSVVKVNEDVQVQISVTEEHLPQSFFNELSDEMESLQKSKEQYRRILAKLEESKPQTTKTKAKPKAKKKLEAPKDKKKLKKAVADHENHHSFIDEIQLKEEKTIDDERKKEQIALINSFIENEPIISKKFTTNDADAKRVIEDLSLSSTNLSEDVVSETLAKLMIKQGHNQKAIDIYKKLIWKFPQKKAYFAEQIENLKKEQ
ncbi:hypothetical protein GCM10011506_15320 [Marivirga lumbricoides]|uniref:Tetratricopeptide repeat protein n=1 Tax=Marivirga lumbricoides TaxID=1046115 RepID=A0ABQ1LYP6_9BACT|nr:hypothetical protein GCM10011506_15320 [Marivirga lumbricoides]